MVDKIVKVKYSRIDLSDYLRAHYEDRISIFEAFGPLFEEITIQYPKDGHLHLKLVRDYSRKTMKRLRLILTDMACVDEWWTEPFELLEELVIGDCEARLENITQLLSLCPKLKRFKIIWTIKYELPEDEDFTGFSINRPAMCYQLKERGGSVSEKFADILKENKGAECFHLYLPEDDEHFEIHRYKYTWNAGEDSNVESGIATQTEDVTMDPAEENGASNQPEGAEGIASTTPGDDNTASNPPENVADTNPVEENGASSQPENVADTTPADDNTASNKPEDTASTTPAEDNTAVNQPEVADTSPPAEAEEKKPE